MKSQPSSIQMTSELQIKYCENFPKNMSLATCLKHQQEVKWGTGACQCLKYNDEMYEQIKGAPMESQTCRFLAKGMIPCAAAYLAMNLN